MSQRLGVVMDPIETIKPYKDSTLAMLLAAQKRGLALHYMEQEDLYCLSGQARARTRTLVVRDDPRDWFTLGGETDLALGDLDFLLMRQDPPFNMRYIYTTYTLDLAAAQGAMVVNSPAAVRNWNEKYSIARFPQCCTPFLISSDSKRLRTFLAEQDGGVIKPLDGMGGQGIFRLTARDPNAGSAIELLTDNGQRPIMAQRYIPEIRDGDKRILMICGKPVDYALARIPAEGEARGNLAAGGRGVGQPLSDRDRWIAAEVGPSLLEAGIYFAGLDVIGDYLTEINVTSPTCIRELDAQFHCDIAGDLIDALLRIRSGRA